MVGAGACRQQGRKMPKMRSKQTLEDKIRQLDESFVEEVQMLATEALKEKLIGLVKYDEELENAKADDEDLQERKAAYDVALEAYSEPLKANKLKRKLVLQYLRTRGDATETAEPVSKAS
jgi:hypothetical protein